jgi:hypothetical protein
MDRELIVPEYVVLFRVDDYLTLSVNLPLKKGMNRPGNSIAALITMGFLSLIQMYHLTSATH